MITKEIYIVHGLPGSGKTTYLHQLQNTMADKHDTWNDPLLYICNVDNTPEKNIVHAVKSELKKISQYEMSYDSIAFDGLFDIDDMCRIILACADHYVKKYKGDIWEDEKLNLKITVLHWNENRDQCVENDKVRGRHKLCTRTIQTLSFCNNINEIESKLESYIEGLICIDSNDYTPYLNNNINTIMELTDFTIEDTQVMNVPAGDKYTNLRVLANADGIIKSDDWCVGGLVGNCWNDHMCAASTDEAPKYFKELVDALLVYDKDFKMTDYLYIIDHFVRVNKRTVYEYYGSYYDYNWYECNVNTIIDYLQEKKD